MWLYSLNFAGARWGASAHCGNPRIARTDTVTRGPLLECFTKIRLNIQGH